MAYPERAFTNGGVFHVFNRGVEKRTTYLDYRDYQRFIETLLHYQQRAEELRRFTRRGRKLEDRKPPFRFDLLAYCLMPNHFHLLFRQTEEGGISQAMGQLLNSYSKYFNTKYKRVGHLFQGRFQAIPVVHDDQLIHVMRYILLNPYVAGITGDTVTYPYSSIRELIGTQKTTWCQTDLIRRYFQDNAAIKTFITDYADEARNRELVAKHIVDD